MRRRSLVAPLLLIALGSLFLARNVFPDLALMDYVARYWPAVLIIWGTLRLIEILVWAASSKPLPSRGVSGSEWALIVFICLAGTSVHAVHGMGSWWPDRFRLGGIEFFGQRFEYPLNGEMASSHAPHITIEDFRGDAKITGADGPDMVKVTGHKSIRSLDQNMADRGNAQTPLEFRGDANNIVLQLHQDNARGPQRVSAALELTVPKGASVEVHGRNGDVDVTDIGGAVVITSDNASVGLRNIGGDARLDLRRSERVHMESVRGAVAIKGRGSDIQLDGMSGPVSVDGDYNGTIQLKALAKTLRFTSRKTSLSVESIPGQLNIAGGDVSAADVAGPTKFSSRSRDVRITEFVGPLDISVERGDLELSTSKLPLGRIQARSRSGDIRLALPPAAQFAVDASTGHGSISNTFGGGLRLDQSGQHGKLSGSVGNGPSIELETRRGDIALQRATAITVTATPLQKLDQ